MVFSNKQGEVILHKMHKEAVGTPCLSENQMLEVCLHSLTWCSHSHVPICKH